MKLHFQALQIQDRLNRRTFLNNTLLGLGGLALNGLSNLLPSLDPELPHLP
ncbi:MAG: hypothetical protein HC892_15100 [Saprospiraceae bacterium]|nr:hypothetical protein [Saprospiraceae bacterium]